MLQHQIAAAAAVDDDFDGSLDPYSPLNLLPTLCPSHTSLLVFRLPLPATPEQWVLETVVSEVSPTSLCLIMHIVLGF